MKKGLVAAPVYRTREQSLQVKDSACRGGFITPYFSWSLEFENTENSQVRHGLLVAKMLRKKSYTHLKIKCIKNNFTVIDFWTPKRV